MTILHIETSTNVCSVALSHDGKCVFSVSNNDGQNHASMLSPFIEQALNAAEKNNMKPDAVSVSAGPGSYTGLRIGVSTAKGLCYGYGIPLIAVSTLEILAVEALRRPTILTDELLCPMIDARRMEVYTAIYNHRLEKLQHISAEIITAESFSQLLEKQPVSFFGNGSEKCKAVISHPNAHFIDAIEPLAENMIPLAEKQFNDNNFADTAYFEPLYLKEFQATTAKKKI